MASQIAPAISSKRRKTKQDVAACLSDLPIGILQHVGSFFAAPSRALFAIALTKNTISPNENPLSIVGSDWDTLDFGAIEEELATKLSDDDISAILQHIDAVNKLKRLRLTNCTKITGVGLEPLRGSTIIEHIDLSLVGDGEDVKLHPDPSIARELVLPILDSIIDAAMGCAEGCALKYVQFPYKWLRLMRRDRSTGPAFHDFLLLYNQMLENRETVRCLHCKHSIPPNGDEWIGTSQDKFYGTHSFTCYQCTKHYCYDCNDREETRWFLRGCHRCEREYCKDCAWVYECWKDNNLPCDHWDCEHCALECNECNDRICWGCVGTEGDDGVCSYCDVAYCEDCNKVDGLDGTKMVRFCSRCSKFCCNSCRLRKYQEGGDHCDGCIKLLPHEQTLIEQVEQLRNEVSALKLVCKELGDGAKTQTGRT